jgi:uncharacterized protein YndB with AHSA1/START domain
VSHTKELSRVKGKVATARIDITAPAGRVWTALVDPEQIKQYMFGSQVVTDWQVGSPIVWKGEYEGKPYEDKGVVLEYAEPSRLSVSHFSPMSGQDDVPENYHTLLYTLDSDGAVTTVSLSQDNNADQEEADRATEIWQQLLAALRQHVEGSQ